MTQRQQLWDYMIPALAIRIVAYDILRTTFLQEPSRSYLKTIALTNMIGDFPFSGESKAIHQGILKITAYFQANNIFDDSIYEQLHWDYTRLFLGPGRLAAPLWESVYRSEERLLFQESTFQVRCAYAKYGLGTKNYRREADDHLGLELDFMYHLAKRAREACQAQAAETLMILDDSRHFLADHLLNWVPALAQDIQLHAGTEFYKGMAAILDGFLEVDYEMLRELINEE